MPQIVFSKYLHAVRVGGKVALFHELHPNPIYCRKEQWDEVSKFHQPQQGCLLDVMRLEKLVLAEAAEDVAELSLVKSEIKRKYSIPFALHLITANDCNMSCGYCPFRSGTGNGRMMSSDDARKGLTLWSRTLWEKHKPDNDYSIIFYGGEPLLNKKVIRDTLEIVERFKRDGLLPQNLITVIATNGLLVDDDVLGWCKKYRVSVQVGLDGDENRNDRHRVDSRGNGVGRVVIGKIKQLVSNKIETSISVSLTSQNFEGIDETWSFVESLGVKKFGFNLIRGFGHGSSLVPSDYYHQAARHLASRLHRNNSRNCVEFSLERKINAFRNRDFFPQDCACYGNQLVILPDGYISNCPFSREIIGHLDWVSDAFQIEKAGLVRHWRNRLPPDCDGLVEFPATALYGGGCAWHCKEYYSNDLVVDERIKWFAQEVMNEIIKSEMFGVQCAD